jgi:hypothetical protein
MSTLESRFAKLERKVRIYQLSFLSIILLTGFFMISGFNNKYKAPDVLQAREFQVVDENGKVYASLKQHDQYCDFKLYNSLGYQIIRLTESTNGYGAIITFDKTENLACKMTGTTGGLGGSITAYNSKGNEVASMTNTTSGAGSVSVNNPGGDIVGQMSASLTEQGNISLYNKSKVRTCILGSDADGNGTLNVFNRLGQNQNGVWPKE